MKKHSGWDSSSSRVESADTSSNSETFDKGFSLDVSRELARHRKEMNRLLEQLTQAREKIQDFRERSNAVNEGDDKKNQDLFSSLDDKVQFLEEAYELYPVNYRKALSNLKWNDLDLENDIAGYSEDTKRLEKRCQLAVDELEKYLLEIEEKINDFEENIALEEEWWDISLEFTLKEALPDLAGKEQETIRRNRPLPPIPENQGAQNRPLPPIPENQGTQNRPLPPIPKDKLVKGRPLPPIPENQGAQNKPLPPIPSQQKPNVDETISADDLSMEMINTDSIDISLTEDPSSEFESLPPSDEESYDSSSQLHLDLDIIYKVLNNSNRFYNALKELNVNNQDESKFLKSHITIEWYKKNYPPSFLDSLPNHEGFQERFKNHVKSVLKTHELIIKDSKPLDKNDKHFVNDFIEEINGPELEHKSPPPLLVAREMAKQVTEPSKKRSEVAFDEGKWEQGLKLLKQLGVDRNQKGTTLKCIKKLYNKHQALGYINSENTKQLERLAYLINKLKSSKESDPMKAAVLYLELQEMRDREKPRGNPMKREKTPNTTMYQFANGLVNELCVVLMNTWPEKLDAKEKKWYATNEAYLKACNTRDTMMSDYKKTASSSFGRKKK